MHIYEQYLSYVNEWKRLYIFLVAISGTLLLALGQITRILV